MGRRKILARVFSNILNYSDDFSLCHVRYSCCKKKVCGFAGHSAVHVRNVTKNFKQVYLKIS